MATVGFGLESANVVGYTEVGLRTGSKGVGACFAPITETNVDLAEITVTGYDRAEGSEDQVYAQTLDASGKTIDMYYWIDVSYEENGETVTLYGWMDAEGNLLEKGSVMMPLGDALWVDAPGEDFKLNFNGEVAKDGVAVSLRAGSKMVSNPLAIDVDINNIAVKGYNTEDGSEDEVYAQTLDGNGKTVDMYYWIDISYEENGEVITLYGWMDAEGNLLEDDAVNVKAGEALWVDAPSADYSFDFPKVSL